MELSYINDSVLRQRIEDSIEFIYALYEQSKQAESSELYRAETYRVIIIYIVSIIEAVLFYVYDQRKNKITKVEYKEKVFFKESYKNTLVDGRMIVAVEKQIEKAEAEISLRELVDFLGKEGVLKRETVTRLLEMMPLRNSVHLRQKKTIVCGIDDVENALEFLVYIITHAQSRSEK